MLDTSIILSEAVTGKRCAFRKSTSVDNDENFGAQRYIEQISVVGERFPNPPEWGTSRGFHTANIAAADTADMTR